MWADTTNAADKSQALSRAMSKLVRGGSYRGWRSPRRRAFPSTDAPVSHPECTATLSLIKSFPPAGAAGNPARRVTPVQHESVHAATRHDECRSSFHCAAAVAPAMYAFKLKRWNKSSIALSPARQPPCATAQGNTRGTARTRACTWSFRNLQNNGLALINNRSESASGTRPPFPARLGGNSVNFPGIIFFGRAQQGSSHKQGAIVRAASAEILPAGSRPACFLRRRSGRAQLEFL